MAHVMFEILDGPGIRKLSVETGIKRLDCLEATNIVMIVG